MNMQSKIMKMYDLNPHCSIDDMLVVGSSSDEVARLRYTIGGFRDDTFTRTYPVGYDKWLNKMFISYFCPATEMVSSIPYIHPVRGQLDERKAQSTVQAWVQEEKKSREFLERLRNDEWFAQMNNDSYLKRAIEVIDTSNAKWGLISSENERKDSDEMLEKIAQFEKDRKWEEESHRIRSGSDAAMWSDGGQEISDHPEDLVSAEYENLSKINRSNMKIFNKKQKKMNNQKNKKKQLSNDKIHDQIVKFGKQLRGEVRKFMPHAQMKIPMSHAITFNEQQFETLAKIAGSLDKFGTLFDKNPTDEAVSDLTLNLSNIFGEVGDGLIGRLKDSLKLMFEQQMEKLGIDASTLGVLFTCSLFLYLWLNEYDWKVYALIFGILMYIYRDKITGAASKALGFLWTRWMTIEESTIEFMSEQMRPQAQMMDTESVSDVLLVALGMYMFPKGDMSVMKTKSFLIDFGRIAHSFESVTGLVMRLFQKLLDWGANRFGFSSFTVMSTNIPKVDAWVVETRDFLDKYNRGMLAKDMTTFDWCCRLEDRSYEILSDFAKSRYSNAVAGVVRQVSNALSKVRVTLEQQGVGQKKTRQPPVVIMLHGVSQIGKSRALRPLIIAILAAVLEPEEFQKVSQDYDSYVYSRQPEHEFWDGYFGQLVCLWDEFDLVSKKLLTANNAHMESVRAGNVFPNVLHMAGIESKGNVYFRSKIIICTSNAPDVATGAKDAVQYPEAVVNRFHFECEVVLNPAFAIDEDVKNLPSNKWRLDPDKLPYDYAFDWNVHRLVHYKRVRRMDGDDQFEYVEAGRYDLQEFLHKVKAKYDQMIRLGAALVRDDVLAAQIGKQVRASSGKGKEKAIAQMDEGHGGAEEEENLPPPWPEYTYHEMTGAVPMEEHFDVAGSISGFVRRWLPGHEVAVENEVEPDDSKSFVTAVPEDSQFSRNANVSAWEKARDEEMTPGHSWGYELGLGQPEHVKSNLTGIYAIDSMMIADFVSRPMLSEKVAYDYLWAMPVAYENFDPAEFVQNKIGYFWKIDQAIELDLVGVKFVMQRMNCNPVFFEVVGYEHFARLVNALGKMERVREETDKDWKMYLAAGIQALKRFVQYIWEGVKSALASAWNSISSFPWRMAFNVGFFNAMVAVISFLVIIAVQMLVILGFKAVNAITGGGKKKTGNRKIAKTNEAEAQLHDPMLDDVATKIWNKNYYEIVFDENHVAWGFFLYDNLFVLPYHYIVAWKARNYGNFLMKLVSTRGEEFELAIRDTFSAVKVCEDIGVVKLPNFRKHADIRPLILSGPSFKGRKNGDCMMIRHQDGTVRREYSKFQVVEDFEYSGPGNKDIKIPLGLSYDIPTSAGECGLPVFIRDPSTRAQKLVGMHVAGTFGHGFATAFEQKLLAHSQLNEQSFPKTMKVIGTVPRGTGTSGKSAIQKSKLYGAWGPAQKAPSRLRPFKNEVGERIDPVENALKRYESEILTYDDKIVKACVADTVASYVNHSGVSFSGLRKCTKEEAILGIEGDPYMDSVNRQSSLGWPWNMNPLPEHSGKERILGKGPIPSLDGPDWEKMDKEIEEARQMLIDGKRPDWYYSDALKDELLKLSKVIEGKSRPFCPSPFSYLVLFNEYWKPLFVKMMHGRIRNECAVGINVYSQEWELLYRKLTQHGKDRVIAGDFKFFDSKQAAQILRALGEELLKLFEDREYDDVRRILWMEVWNSKHIVGKYIVEWLQSLPSGHPATTLINCLFNSIVFRMAYVKIYDNDLSVLKRFCEVIKLIVYGDDNAASIARAELRANQNTFGKAFAELGLEYTAEDKSSDPPDFRSIYEIEFLKRKFRYEPLLGRHVAPLRLESILEMPYWTKTKMAEEITRGNVDNAIRELALHDQEVFDEWSEKMRKASVEKMQYQPVIYDRETLLDIVVDNPPRYW